LDRPLTSNDRFDLELLADFRSTVRSTAEPLEHQVAVLLERSSLSIDTSGEGESTNLMPIRVRLANETCASVARNLIDIDLELRRTCVYLTSGGTRPTGDSHIVKVGYAMLSNPNEVLLRVGGDLRILLTSRPILFLETLDWFWLHRHTRIKVRVPNEVLDPTSAWAEMLRQAGECIAREELVDVFIDVSLDGAATFGFRGERESSF
jgi:hypothetical protein